MVLSYYHHIHKLASTKEDYFFIKIIDDGNMVNTFEEDTCTKYKLEEVNCRSWFVRLVLLPVFVFFHCFKENL